MRTTSHPHRFIILFISLFLISDLILSSQNRPAFKSISCTHKFYCNLAQKLITLKQNTSIRYFHPPTTKSDPHHFSPHSKTIKLLIASDYLLTGPELLSPWAASIIQLKSKQHSHNVFSWELTQKKHALAHLWLYPKLFCAYQKALKNQLANWQLELKTTSTSCDLNFETTQKKYQQSLKQYFKLPVIITHDSLSPLFETLGLEYFVIKSQGHHQQISLKTLKGLQNFLQLHPQVIWIYEAQIHLALSIQKKLRAKDFWFKIDTAGKNNNGPFQFYDILLAKQLKTGVNKDHDK